VCVCVCVYMHMGMNTCVLIASVSSLSLWPWWYYNSHLSFHLIFWMILWASTLFIPILQIKIKVAKCPTARKWSWAPAVWLQLPLL
jgi:hypothetical protein